MATEQLATIIENKNIAQNTFRMVLQLSSAVDEIRPGQFCMVSTGDGARILKRPFGIEWYSAQRDQIALCYQTVGAGTQWLKNSPCGQQLEVVLPLGNGFFLSDEVNIALLGGGAGVFPLASLPLYYNRDNGENRNFYGYFGFRNKAIVAIEEDCKQLMNLKIATDDGSYGTPGYAQDLLLQDLKTIPFDVILACGPKPMLAALKKTLVAQGVNIPTYVSMEERMACGVGACLVCVCKQTAINKNVRVCKDGPVFNIMEVEL